MKFVEDATRLLNDDAFAAAVVADRTPPLRVVVWIDDLEHGLMHSLCTAFMASYVSGEEMTPRLLASVLMHDYLKTHGWAQEDHDRELETYWPNLDPVVYTHSRPDDADHPLILGDRTELHRYEDFEDWREDRHMAFMQRLSPSVLRGVEAFYGEFRQGLRLHPTWSDLRRETILNMVRHAT